jgi:2-succinyl-5-enolpyruvyl-6-hydroxy-3-cyclohexene-1-carboxylate synthase
MTRGVLLFGPDTFDAATAESAQSLAAALGWPVIADPASGLRAGARLDESLITGADLLLRDDGTSATLSPQIVVRCGGLPTSKAVSAWLDRHATAALWLVDPAAGFRDPQHRATRTCAMSVAQLAGLAAGGGPPDAATLAWRDRWLQADRSARAAVNAGLDAEPGFFAPHVARELWSQLPPGATLYAANSMPIRELDSFTGRRSAELRVLANRGVNGIDGLVSSALGASVALHAPTVLWCGDLALLHDLSGMLAGRLLKTDLTIVVTNDDGGGIFEYLPVANRVPRETFEHLFAAPHGLDLSELARGLGWQAVRVDSAATFTGALDRALHGGRHLIEIPMDRAANTAFHRRLHELVQARLQAEAAR